MAHRKRELERIIKDLKGLLGKSCQFDPNKPHDFVSEKCGEACLMLEEAREALLEKKSTSKK
jgi:hypothetical protein